MPDPRFFKRSAPLSLNAIAALSGARLHESSDPEYIIEDVAPLDVASSQDLSFLENKKYKNQFFETKAGACFVSPDIVQSADIPVDLNLLIADYPYKAYALTAQAFYPDPLLIPGVHPSAVVDDTAVLGDGVQIDPGAVIGPAVELGDHVHIGAHVVIGAGVRIGDHTRIGVQATISHAIIGAYGHIYPGVRIGQDGFGFAIDPAGHIKVPQLGRVVIEDHVHIGANTTIDRGAGPDTVIGQGTWIDNLVQIGHNVKIGRGCIIVAQTGISGSTVLEDFVALGGQSGVAGHLHIGSGARVAAQSGIMRDIPAGEEHMGYPAIPIKQFMRQVAALNRLIKKPKSA